MPPETTPPKTGIALETPFAKVAFVNFVPKTANIFSILDNRKFSLAPSAGFSLQLG